MISEYEANNSLGVHLRGTFNFFGNTKTNFMGPIKKGLRLILWGYSFKRATTLSFVSDGIIHLGESKVTDIVILSPQSIDKRLAIGEEYSIGMPDIVVGSFVLKEFVGIWSGKVP